LSQSSGDLVFELIKLVVADNICLYRWNFNAFCHNSTDVITFPAAMLLFPVINRCRIEHAVVKNFAFGIITSVLSLKQD